MATGETLVDEFLKDGWKSNPFDKLMAIIHKERDQALPLALLIIDRLPKGGTFFDLLLSYLTEDALLQIEDTRTLLPISLERIEFYTCMSCLGWEADALFFVHDESGIPSPFSEYSEKVEPAMPAEPLKETPVQYVLSPPRWGFQDWALSNGRENLNRIGGAPSWIQDSQYPECPKCNALMVFVAQLDSNLPTVGGEEWLWGSGGICYLFWCDNCRVSGSLWQCT